MDKIEVQIVDDAVKRITDVMKHGRFTREDLEMIKKLFQKGIEVTDRAIEKGDRSGTQELQSDA